METVALVYTPEEIQDILGIGRNTALNMIKKDPPFPVKKISNRTYRIPKKPFDEWIETTYNKL